MQTIDTLFKAIAHPARREMIALLSVSARSVKELTAEFDMSQPAISQHLRELKEAKLVHAERVGLEQRYSLTAAPLKLISNWTEQYRRLFDPSGHAWQFAASGMPARDIPAKKQKKGRHHGR